MTDHDFHKRWGWGPDSGPAPSGPWVRDMDRIVCMLAIATTPWYVRLWHRVLRWLS